MSILYRLAQVDYSYTWNQQSVPVLKGLDLQVQKGCFLCLVGPSGTGKTTLLNLLGLIDQPSGGEVFFEEQSTQALSENSLEKLRLSKIGFVFQSFHLLPTLSVLENTSYFLPHLGVQSDMARKQALEVLDLLGLADQAQKRPSALSGGQRQRVAIARAIVKRPDVILADEPTANLDQETAAKIIDAFRSLQKFRGTSFIFSTHDPHLMELANTVYRFKAGHLELEKKI